MRETKSLEKFGMWSNILNSSNPMGYDVNGGYGNTGCGECGHGSCGGGGNAVYGITPCGECGHGSCGGGGNAKLPEKYSSNKD